MQRGRASLDPLFVTQNKNLDRNQNQSNKHHMAKTERQKHLADKKVFRLRELAEVTGLGYGAVRRAVAEGKLKSLRPTAIHLVTREAAAEWLGIKSLDEVL